MANRYGVNWNTEETILALDLYFRIPFGQISGKNKNIIELADLLGRTPGSVALKLSNLAHFDPALQKRNIKGMSNGSKLDGKVFQTYYHHFDQLAFDADRIKQKLLLKTSVKENNKDYGVLQKEGFNKEYETKVRVGQSFFRAAVLSSYNNRCCVTGIADPRLLIASHIKPWAVSNAEEKTSPDNGLCLNALHDKAFDQGLITLDMNYKIIVSDQLLKTPMDDETKNWFMSYKGTQIQLPDRYLPNKEFIEYHNDVIFLH